MKKISSIVIGIFLPLVMAVPAYADSACANSGSGFNFYLLCQFGQPGGTLSTGSIIGRVVALLLLAAVLVALIFLVVGGIRWITSGGDKTKLDSARSHIVAAIVGLVIALLAYLIINVILQAFGLNAGGISNFNLPSITGK